MFILQELFIEQLLGGKYSSEGWVYDGGLATVFAHRELPSSKWEVGTDNEWIDMPVRPQYCWEN